MDAWIVGLINEVMDGWLNVRLLFFCQEYIFLCSVYDDMRLTLEHFLLISFKT